MEVKEFTKETWELFPGAEGWETKDGRELPPFYRLVEGYYIIANFNGVQFIGDEEAEELEVDLYEFPDNTSSRIKAKKILEKGFSYISLSKLVEDFPEVKKALSPATLSKI